jgi:hypothetical protein
VGIDDPTPRLVDAPTFPGNPSVQEGIDALRRGINTIIFRPGAPSRFPAYSLWTEIQQILSTSETPIHVLVDSSLAAADVPGFTGITDFRGGTLRAFDNNAIVAIRNGATLQNLSRIQGFGSDNLFPVVYECNTTPAFSFTGAPTNYALAFENVAFTANAGPNVALRLNPGDVLAIYGDSTTFPFGGGMIDNAGLLTITARKRGGAIAANYVPDDLVIGANPAASYSLFYDSDITGGLGHPTSPIPVVTGFAGTYEAIGLLSPLAIPTGGGIPVTADRDALAGEIVHVNALGGPVAITLPQVSTLPNGTPVTVKCVAITPNSVTVKSFGGGETIDGAATFVLTPAGSKKVATFVSNYAANSWDVISNPPPGASSAGGAVLFWGALQVTGTTTTRYLSPGYDGSGPAPILSGIVQFRIPRPGTLRNFYIHQGDPAGNGNPIVYTVRINNVATAILVSVASTATDGSDLVDSVVVAAGDLVDIQVSKAVSTAASPQQIMATIELA